MIVTGIIVFLEKGTKMSRFYADIQGNRGEATRQGSKASGIRGHIRGWDSGAQVYCGVNSDGKDVVEVYLTRGSSGNCVGSKAASGFVSKTVDGKLVFLAKKKDFK